MKVIQVNKYLENSRIWYSCTDKDIFYTLTGYDKVPECLYENYVKGELKSHKLTPVTCVSKEVYDLECSAQ